MEAALRRSLPPLNALRSFEAAARHQSFTRAADELSVTQGAVSHQVKALEAELGLKLFNREHQGLAMTDAGSETQKTQTTILKDIDALLHREDPPKSDKNQDMNNQDMNISAERTSLRHLSAADRSEAEIRSTHL